jgi:zinc transport system substrate-binding protein
MRNADGKINITTTFFAPYDFIRNIASEQGLQDRINLSMLLPPGSESHSFEPSPRDIITIQNSDIFIYIGGETENWVDRILHSMNTDNMKILALLDTVEALEEEIVEGMEHKHQDHEDHDYHHEHKGFFARLFTRIFRHDHVEDHHHDDYDSHDLDEHIWTSPKNAILIVRVITNLLCDVDTVNASLYRQNAAAYIEALIELDTALEELVAGASRRTIVFGDRFPFRYLAHDYGLQYFAAFPGCFTETEPSAATVAFLINKIRDEQIPVVFHIELSNERMANTISKETGSTKLLLHSVHNVSKRDFDAGLGYLDFMRRNVEHLREALY